MNCCVIENYVNFPDYPSLFFLQNCMFRIFLYFFIQYIIYIEYGGNGRNNRWKLSFSHKK